MGGQPNQAVGTSPDFPGVVTPRAEGPASTRSAPLLARAVQRGPPSTRARRKPGRSSARRPRKGAFHMTRLESRSTRTGRRLDVAARTALLLSLLAGLAACATTAPPRMPSLVSESDYARVPVDRTQRVDEARQQLSAARDALGRAKLSSVTDQQEGTFARADQASAKAGQTRAAAETQASKESNDPGQLRQALDNTARPSRRSPARLRRRLRLGRQRRPRDFSRHGGAQRAEAVTNHLTHHHPQSTQHRRTP